MIWIKLNSFQSNGAKRHLGIELSQSESADRHADGFSAIISSQVGIRSKLTPDARILAPKFSPRPHFAKNW